MNVDKAIGGHQASAFVRQLATKTYCSLTKKAAKGQLSQPEQEQLAAADSYTRETARGTEGWDPMTEVRVETDVPPGHRPPRD